jgi:hypothetical protein
MIFRFNTNDQEHIVDLRFRRRSKTIFLNDEKRRHVSTKSIS